MRRSLASERFSRGVSLAWLPATRRWRAWGHLCWAASMFLFAAYLAFVLQWTFISNLGAASTAGGVLLWLFEVFAALLACAYLWELCETLGTEHWRRRVTAGRQAELPECEDGEMPFVSLHGLHVDRSWGRGVMPLTFEALKSQRYRWCFGGIQIMRMHWRSLLPGSRIRGIADMTLPLVAIWRWASDPLSFRPGTGPAFMIVGE